MSKVKTILYKQYVNGRIVTVQEVNGAKMLFINDMYAACFLTTEQYEAIMRDNIKNYPLYFRRLRCFYEDSLSTEFF